MHDESKCKRTVILFTDVWLRIFAKTWPFQLMPFPTWKPPLETTCTYTQVDKKMCSEELVKNLFWNGFCNRLHKQYGVCTHPMFENVNSVIALRKTITAFYGYKKHKEFRIQKAEMWLPLCTGCIDQAVFRLTLPRERHPHQLVEWDGHGLLFPENL